MRLYGVKEKHETGGSGYLLRINVLNLGCERLYMPEEDSHRTIPSNVS